MRLALILSLTMLLLGCDNELELDTSSGTWEFTAGYNNPEINTGWLLNKETGELRICKEVLDLGTREFRRDCYPMYEPRHRIRVDADGNIIEQSGVPDFSL